MCIKKIKENRMKKDMEEKKEEEQSLVSLDVRGREFQYIMNVYDYALRQVYQELMDLKDSLYETYQYHVIDHITGRVKEANSIVHKMKKKNYDLTLKSMVENLNDIAGLRIICPLKSDIDKVIKAIKKNPNMRILKSKDYLKKPKSSGYSGYHLITETRVKIQNEWIFVKVEIQLRTMTMDSWATNEHKMKYKTKQKLSLIDSKRLTLYGKIINLIDDKIMKISKKQEKKNKVPSYQWIENENAI